MSTEGLVTGVCRCLPFQQSWRAETPGWCATCGLPFTTFLKAREVCLKTEECLLLPDHEGSCDSNQDDAPASRPS